MADLFFYGTLCHVPLLARVLGREADGLDLTPAQLTDHSAWWAGKESFPILVPQQGAVAHGLLARGLSDIDVARLRFYEGGFDYDLIEVQVTTATDNATAQVFFPVPNRWPVGEPWSLADWEARWAPTSMQAAEEIMAWFGLRSAAEISARFMPIGIRAGAYVAARDRPADPARNAARDVVVHERRRSYMNFFALDEIDLQFRRHDGSLSALINRAALFVGEAVVVLPYDPQRDVVLLVEQFRTPVFMVGDPSPWVWEPVAGLIDPGETPEQAAAREAQEEAGLTLRHLEPAGGVYSSTGSSSEFLNLFIGIADLPDIPEGGGGVLSEGEDIRSRLFTYDELMQGVDDRRFRDMPLVTTALWLARHRDRLRQQG